MTYSRRLIKSLASLKLAVLIMALLIVLIAWGTIIESRYDAEAARKTIYDTWWMYTAMGLLSVSLIAVMADRWPWKKRHIPFILAHIGILVLMTGAVLTMKAGIDGSATVEIGKQSRWVVLPHETDLLVYASFGGGGMAKISDSEVDFFRNPPSESHPFDIPVNREKIQIVDYKKYVVPRREVIASDEPSAAPGLRFQIQNARVSVIEWLVPKVPGALATHDFGPARIHLGETPSAGGGRNEIYLTPLANGKIHWTMFKKEGDKPVASGITEEGGLVETGWMGLQLRILRFLPHAREKWDFEERSAPTELTSPAVKVRFRGKDQWMLLNDTVRLFTEDTAYLVSYVNRRLDLGFPIQLKSFEMIPYQGTRRAKQYQSVVTLPGREDVVISMNEPAVQDGLTIYQASFQNNEQGQPVASVFSINRDPGRGLKYLGSLIIVAGIILMFWGRRRPKTAGKVA